MFSSYQQKEEESSKLLPRFGEFEEAEQNDSLASRAGADITKAASTKSFRIVCLLFAVVSIMFSVSPSVISGGSPSSLRSQFTSLDGTWDCPQGNSNPDGYCSVCCPAGSSAPTTEPSASPSHRPSHLPTALPTESPSVLPTFIPSENPSKSPTAVPTFIPTAPTAAPTTAVLLHRYSFNDGTAADSISGLDATLMGGAYISSGRVTLVKASSSYIQLPANVLGSTTSLSIEFWVRAASGNTMYTRMFEVGPAQANNNVGSIAMYRMATDAMGMRNRFFGNDRTSYSTATFGTVSTDMHIVLTISTSGSVMTTLWYVNGVLSSTQIGTFTSGGSVDSTQGYLGKSFWTSDPYLDGSFNEFRVWSNVLSASAVKLNYVNGPDTIVV